MATESNALFRTGNVIVLVGDHVDGALSISPVWREYKDPDELETLRANGASEEWLRRHVVEKTKEADVWYAFVQERDQALAQFMVIAAAIIVGADRFPGYLTLVDGEVSSASILEPDVLLSTSDELADENSAALRTLSEIVRRPVEDLLPIRFEVEEGTLNGRFTSGSLSIGLEPTDSDQRTSERG